MKSKHSTGISATKSRIPISIHTSNSAFSFPGGAGRQASNSLCGMQILLDRPETTERGCLINHGRWMERRNRTHASGRDRRRCGRIYSFYLHTYEGVGFYFFHLLIYICMRGDHHQTNTHAHAGGVTTVLPRYLAGGGLARSIADISSRPHRRDSFPTPNRTYYTRRLPQHSQCRGQQKRQDLGFIDYSLLPEPRWRARQDSD